ncbi:hypothetical protein Tco_0418383 [Tanacetum coccineum]
MDGEDLSFGVKKMTIDNYDVLLETWEVDNSKIITWINNSVTPSIGLQLAKYETTKLNDTSIQDFNSSMSALWDQLALTEPASLSNFDPYIKQRESQRLVQFLMTSRQDFEGLSRSILHREPLLYVDFVVSELLAEEIRLKSLDDQKIVTKQVSTNCTRVCLARWFEAEAGAGAKVAAGAEAAAKTRAKVETETGAYIISRKLKLIF